MTKAEAFNEARLLINDRAVSIETAAGYMSDMGHWCMVHATQYMPRKNADGTMYIPSTGMATDFEIPRATVHVTLNHIVASHGYGSWDDAPIIVLAPYNAVAEKNGNPAQVAGTDTYWSVNPDKGLVLPESAYIIQPDNNGPLYKIDEHGATYKRDNYTDEEIAQIESLLSSSDRAEYEKYKNGDIQQWELEREFESSRTDKRVKEMYDSAKDKRAFLRGLFEEDRFAILSKYLRDAVTRLAMEKVGFEYIDSVHDGGTVSESIANVAKAHNIDATPSNKGHNGSLYNKMEGRWSDIIITLRGDESKTGILKMTDMDAIYDRLAHQGQNLVLMAILLNLAEDKPIDFEPIYQDCYQGEIKTWIKMSEWHIKEQEREIQEWIPKYDVDEERKRELVKKCEDTISHSRNNIKVWSERKTIADYDKNLAETIRRNCVALSKEYEAWRAELSKQPGFDKLVQRLRQVTEEHRQTLQSMKLEEQSRR